VASAGRKHFSFDSISLIQQVIRDAELILLFSFLPVGNVRQLLKVDVDYYLTDGIIFNFFYFFF
jgi:hypothetical protein